MLVFLNNDMVVGGEDKPHEDVLPASGRCI